MLGTPRKLIIFIINSKYLFSDINFHLKYMIFRVLFFYLEIFIFEELNQTENIEFFPIIINPEQPLF